MFLFRNPKACVLNTNEYMNIRKRMEYDSAYGKC